MPLPFDLVTPAAEHLPAYCAALESGWSPDNMRGRAASDQQLAQIAEDAASFLATLNAEDPGEARVTLPDGSTVPRLPSVTRWIWSDGFAGHIQLRWQPGTDALPPTCLGHIGYSVVPWLQRQGFATRALAAILPEAAARGLGAVQVTCAPDNLGSRKVIEANGGKLVEQFHAPAAFGGEEILRFRIGLAPEV